MAVFNKTIILLALVGYEMIIANSARWLSTISYPTRTRGIIVNYLFIPFFFEKRGKKRTLDTIFFFFTSTNVFVLGEVRKRKMRTDKGLIMSATGLFVSKTKIRKCSI